jgi:hypothetical protein
VLDLGMIRPGSTIYVPFATFAGATGAPITLTGLAAGDVLIYKDGGTTERASSAGVTLLDTDGIDFDAKTGIHGISISLADNTTSGFYTAGSRYFVVIGDVTVDSQTLRFVAATFTIGYEGAILDTTIATLASQTSFTLTAGSADDNAYVGCPVLIHDIASAVQVKVGYCSAYTGSTKTVTLAADPGVFTVAAGDNISVMMPANVRAFGGLTVTGRDIGASVLLSSGTNTGQVKLSSGYVAPNWGDVGNPTTSLNLSATTISTSQAVASVSGNVGGSVASVTGNVGGAVASVTGNVGGSVGSVTGAVGSVTGAVGSVAGNIGGNVVGSIGSLAAQAKADVNAEVDTALADIHLDHLLATDYDPASKPGTATALLNELVESDAGVSRFSANTLEQAPSGGGAVADWTADERTALRAILGIPASGTTPADPTSGILDTIRDTIGAAGAGLTAIPWNAAWDAEVQSECADALTAYGASTLTTGNIPTAAAVASQVRTELTTELARIDVATSTRLATAGYTAGPDSATIADKILGRSIAGGADGGRTVTQALYALRNKVTVISGTMTVYAADDSTIAWTATVTTDAAADPVTGVDPA